MNSEKDMEPVHLISSQDNSNADFYNPITATGFSNQAPYEDKSGSLAFKGTSKQVSDNNTLVGNAA
jgi:hypothetical protein